MGDAAILIGLTHHGHEFRNLRVGKDVLPLPVDEVELLQPRECPHQATENITDTFLVAEDAESSSLVSVN